MSEVVLDASAVLALLNREPGAEEVEKTIPGAAIGAVNLSEVVAKLAERGMPEEAIRLALSGIELDVTPFDGPLAYRAGLLRVSTRGLGLSFGDRACLALGRQLGMPVLTADRRWSELSVGVEVRVIR
ncbi:MAG TPA: type II toxin-antitoxin system VapC family toxin [Thermoanaerobaculia bacterium]|nr:type II toxin-antitoxin system VapC family toxin [Thermoanaerobaculia bacterium]